MKFNKWTVLAALFTLASFYVGTRKEEEDMKEEVEKAVVDELDRRRIYHFIETKETR